MQDYKRSAEYQRLQKLTHHNLLSLVDAELNLASTMLDLSETEAELGSPEHARALLEKVNRALMSVRQHESDGLLSEDEKRDTDERVHDLDASLRAAGNRVEELLAADAAPS